MSAFILLAVFTTSGTFMLLFLAALQNISADVEEAAVVDGTTGWQRFRYVTLPMLRPTLFTVLTLGLIGTWQVFDQIYTGTQGGPAKTTLTPGVPVLQLRVQQPGVGPTARRSRSSCSRIIVVADDPAAVGAARAHHGPATQAVRAGRSADDRRLPARDAPTTAPAVAGRRLRDPAGDRVPVGLPVRHPGDDVLQDRGRGGEQPARTDPADVDDRGVQRAVPALGLPALVPQLGASSRWSSPSAGSSSTPSPATRWPGCASADAV